MWCIPGYVSSELELRQGSGVAAGRAVCIASPAASTRVVTDHAIVVQSFSPGVRRRAR